MLKIMAQRLYNRFIYQRLSSYLGYITFFSMMSAFSWLNVMCFDIWQTFG